MEIITWYGEVPEAETLHEIITEIEPSFPLQLTQLISFTAVEQRGAVAPGPYEFSMAPILYEGHVYRNMLNEAFLEEYKRTKDISMFGIVSTDIIGPESDEEELSRYRESLFHCVITLMSSDELYALLKNLLCYIATEEETDSFLARISFEVLIQLGAFRKLSSVAQKKLFSFAIFRPRNYDEETYESLTGEPIYASAKVLKKANVSPFILLVETNHTERLSGGERKKLVKRAVECEEKSVIKFLNKMD
jgi:hypothetical protein